MQELAVYAATPPLTAACRGPASAKLVAAGPQIVEDKENFLPSGAPSGAPLLPPSVSLCKVKEGQKEQPSRRPLADVTHHYVAASKSIAIGALGSSFGLPTAPSTCGQEAAAVAAAMEAAAAGKRQAARRQALRAMR
ncbi:hypothetical protein ABPG77_002299 [Micractinium sp. CCAP 211/92]